MKKIKKKLLTAMLYTFCWRNVDKSVSVWIYAKYDLLGGKYDLFFSNSSYCMFNYLLQNDRFYICNCSLCII